VKEFEKVQIVQDRTRMDDFAAARRAMIDSQLRVSGVTAGFVLARMAAVPREDFVPAAVRGQADADRATPCCWSTAAAAISPSWCGRWSAR
jgi:protein-L-isoaspartate(D-aspartate) O-methyltransferase